MEAERVEELAERVEDLAERVEAEAQWDEGRPADLVLEKRGV